MGNTVRKTCGMAMNDVKLTEINSGANTYELKQVKIHHEDKVVNERVNGEMCEFKCYTCGFILKDESLYLCDRCGFRSKTFSECINHHRLHHELENGFLCSYCGFTTSDFPFAEEHIKNHHRKRKRQELDVSNIPKRSKQQESFAKEMQTQTEEAQTEKKVDTKQAESQTDEKQVESRHIQTETKKEMVTIDAGTQTDEKQTVTRAIQTDQHDISVPMGRSYLSEDYLRPQTHTEVSTNDLTNIKNFSDSVSSAFTRFLLQQPSWMQSFQANPNLSSSLTSRKSSTPLNTCTKQESLAANFNMTSILPDVELSRLQMDDAVGNVPQLSVARGGRARGRPRGGRARGRGRGSAVGKSKRVSDDEFVIVPPKRKRTSTAKATRNLNLDTTDEDEEVPSFSSQPVAPKNKFGLSNLDDSDSDSLPEVHFLSQ